MNKGKGKGGGWEGTDEGQSEHNATKHPHGRVKNALESNSRHFAPLTANSLLICTMRFGFSTCLRAHPIYALVRTQRTQLRAGMRRNPQFANLVTLTSVIIFIAMFKHHSLPDQGRVLLLNYPNEYAL